MNRGRSETTLALAQLMSGTDTELAEALVAQRPEAPQAAVRRFSPMVRGILRRALGANAAIDDATQEVFLQLFRKLPTLRRQSALRAFVMAITIRTAMHQIRRAKRHRWLALSATDASGDRPSRVDVAAQHAVIRLESLLLGVRPKDRAAFVMRYVEGMQVDEIAALMRISPATVQRRFRRARTRVLGLARGDMFLRQYVAG